MLGLQVGDGGLQIAATHGELDGDVASSGLAKDLEAAFADGDVGDLCQRNPVAVRCGHQDLANCLRCVAIALRIANGEVKAPLALDDLRDGSSADGCLHDGVDVAGEDPVARGAPRDRWR